MKSKFLFFFISLAYLASAQLNLNLTACYPLNGNATDLVNNLNGTSYSVTGGTDRFNVPNSAMVFAGDTGSYITFPNHPFLKANPVSISMWFQATTLDNWMDILFTKNTKYSFFTSYSIVLQNMGNGFRIRSYRQNGQTEDYVESSTIIQSNTWYHVVTTLDASSMKLYVNGNLESSLVPVITGFDYDPNKLVILGGTREYVWNKSFIGKVDNLRFYNRILSASEATQLFNSDPGCENVKAGLPIQEIGGIKIIPNPGAEKVEIQFPGIFSGNIRITDIAGTVMENRAVNERASIDMDLSHFPPAIYFMEVSYSGRLQRIKIIRL
jgi:hypothetical protein